VLNRRIIEREFALSGSEQNPDITGKDVKLTLRTRIQPGVVPGPIQNFMDNGEDFIVRDSLRELVAGMNALTDEPLLDYDSILEQIVARDRQVRNPSRSSSTSSRARR
jgi:predicted oxidoreductase